MAASLINLTVPLASDQSAQNQGLLMPKLKYRFRVIFENFGVGQYRTELTKQVMDFARPNLNFNPVTLDIYNSKIYMVGKPEWQEITVQLRDDALGRVTQMIGSQVQRQFDFLNQASAVAGIDYKFTTRFEALDGGNGAATPNVIERWRIDGCFISTVNYNDFNYQTNDASTISMTLRYDNAIQEPVNGNNGGVGTTSGLTFRGNTITG